ncbi:MAG TPA: ABC transporter permease [Acidimicrobiia bacterium]|nr:ABC transporter permease [Acidimicrobiia bacterium]
MTAITAPPPPAATSEAAARAARRRRRAPYLLLAPGLLWLVAFYVVPLTQLLRTSLQAGTLETGYRFTWEWSNYAEVFTTYRGQFLRSLGYASAATLITLVIAYPLAYTIAFRGGRYKNLFLVLLLMPLLTPFLLRTLAWRIILADQGVVVEALKSIGFLPSNGRLLATGWAVVAGIVYNFLPFMALPIYVSLEKIERNLLEAANDLYATPATSFWKVTWPLSLPGVISGTLLTLIPAAGDYVNVSLLGNPQQAMMGNVIQNKFLSILDYPAAAAISVTLMAAIVLLVIFYVRSVGTEELAG